MSLTACRLESISGCLPAIKKWSRQNRLAHLEAILLFCSTFTYLPSAAFATHGTPPPVPCCLAAGLGTVWAQSTRWEMSWRRGQTPISPVSGSGFQHLLMKSSFKSEKLRLAGVWHLSRAGTRPSCLWFMVGNCIRFIKHTNSLSFTVVDWYGWSA